MNKCRIFIENFVLQLLIKVLLMVQNNTENSIFLGKKLFANAGNILTYYVDVEKNHASRQTPLKFEMEKLNEYFNFFRCFEGSIKHV